MIDKIEANNIREVSFEELAALIQGLYPQGMKM